MSANNSGVSPPRGEDAPEQQSEDEDDVSITSTNVGINDSTKDWFVDGILAERQHPDDPDIMQYLIKWEGFELEDCTWEPIENLGDELITTWEENKAEVEAGTREAFDLTRYEAALAERAERHERRNAKRQRLGMPLTEPFPPGYSSDESEYSDSDDEMGDADSASLSSSKPKPRTSISTRQSARPVAVKSMTEPLPTVRKASKQTMFKGVPTYASSVRGRSSYTPPTRPSTRPSTPGSSWPRTSGHPRRGSITGYQGTAGRSSAFRPAARGPPSGPAGTNRAPAASGLSASSSMPTTNPRDKLHKATRTRQPAAAPPRTATNVFAGGKTPKRRQTLADVMADPSKAPKAFHNLRILNIAKKRAIEKGEVAGALTSIPSKFIINNDQPANKLNLPPLGTVGPFTQPGYGTQGTRPAPAISPVTAHSSIKSALQGSSNEASASKPKKSVRFTGGDNDEPTSAIDPPVDSLDMATSPGGMEADTHAPQPSRKLSFENYQGRGQAQTIEKLVKFGASEPVLASFTGITRHTVPWLSALKAENILYLSATSTAFHFISQKHHMISEKLSTGSVEPALPEHAVALENIATSLLRRSIGLHLVTPSYSILVYPARCEGWDQLGVGDKPNPDASLRHLIYSSSVGPQAYPCEVWRGSEAVKKFIQPNGPDKSELIEVLTGLDFAQMLPQDPNSQNRQAYMLLIPLKSKQLLGVIMTWLRLHQPHRPIFTLEQRNGWYSFCEAVQAGAGGTVISDAEFTKWNLEKIPWLWRMLEDQKYTFWHLDTGRHKHPQFPSDLMAKSVPGRLQLTRLFPYGRAFFITPSFAISEPAKLCSFLKWFRRFAPNPGHTIVACHDFHKFLRNITKEKERERHNMTALNPDNKNLDIFFERTGRSKQDIEDHFRAWEVLQDIMEKFGDEETSEGIRKVHYLTDLIDPSDEQSLVNSFCWWAQMKLDRYRRFYVLGSDKDTIQRAYRYIDIPRYFDTEGSDPDVAAVLRQQRQSAVKQSICETPYKFPTLLFQTGDGWELAQWAESIKRRFGINWGTLHSKVVSWYDRNMAAQFGDGDSKRSQFDTFSGWFTTAPSFTTRQNTRYALFYTITDTWDEYMPRRKYERHPWIAICRPKNVHLFAKGGWVNQIELFIWDLAAADREKSGEALLDMQCKLVDYVYNTVPQQYDGCSLSDVWYSSQPAFQVFPDDNPLDITCRQIQEMFIDMKKELPAVYVSEKWKSIDPQIWTNGMSPMRLKGTAERPSALALERIPQTEEDQLKRERVICHPVPRTIGSGKTKCLNDLHEACLKARLRDPNIGHIKYQYRPTQEWWADQEAEGRDYGYICVDSGCRIIERLQG